MTADKYLVVYATRQGHTRQVAERLAHMLETDGIDAETLNAADAPPDLNLCRYRAALLVGSVHSGRHERALVDFARAHRDALLALPSALVSVSMTEAIAENRQGAAETRARAAVRVQQYIDDFIAETGWAPRHEFPVAGALLYTQYGFFMRLFVRNLARLAGEDTDTSHDHVYTDWAGLDQFAANFAYRAAHPGPGL